jgi:shikimate kinase
MLDPKDLFQPKTSIILTGLMTKDVEAYVSKAKRIFIVGQSGAGSEDKFNQTLTEIPQHQITQENTVVTTDENVACDPKAREILKSEFTVYIEVSTSVQAERMNNYRSLLPVDDYSALLDRLQKERNPWFAEVASFTINSDNGDIERDAKSVVEAYNK